MADINSFFPSKYLKAADLNGETRRVVIENLEAENLGNETKPVLYLRGERQGVVLNKTRAYPISKAYGTDTRQWVGKEVILFEDSTNYKGDVVPCIGIRIPSPRDPGEDESPF